MSTLQQTVARRADSLLALQGLLVAALTGLSCHSCHAYPPPDILPRSAWRDEIAQIELFRRGQPHPVDLDRDGRNDLLVANPGSYQPGDHDKGGVAWLRHLSDGRFAVFG